VDEIRELLQRLAQLTDEEMTDLREKVKTQFGELDNDDASLDDIKVLTELGEITQQIMAECATKETQAQEAQEAREAAREQIKALGGEEEPEEPADEDEKPEPEDEEKPDPEAETSEEAPVEEPALAAAGGTVQRMAKRKPVPSPEATPTSTSGVLTAAAGQQAGRPIEDREDLAREMIRHLNLLNPQAPYGKVIVASAQLEYPEDRRVHNGPEDIGIVERICGPGAPAYDPRTGEAIGQSLTATGGICQPVNVDYSIPTWATADTPITDGLPSFEATRGGIRYVAPPDVAEWEGASGIWTEATDAEPGSATKPVKTMVCGEELSAYVEAVSCRLGFGNMQSRFAPEQVAANTDLAMVAHARVKEENLLNLIEGLANKKIETAQHLGATRDLMSNVYYAVAAYRNIHRIPDTQAFTAILPVYVKEFIRADLLREQAHDNGTGMNVWEIGDDFIDSIFRTVNVNVIWHLDGQKEPTSKNFESQYAVATHVAEGKKIDEIFPAAALETKGLAWYLFPEGAVQRLDAGRLDLGVVRDSTLDATNDYECFFEVFETVVKRSFANGIWQILSVLKATGGSAATVTAVAP
jgi:hypothetical protein